MRAPEGAIKARQGRSWSPHARMRLTPGHLRWGPYRQRARESVEGRAHRMVDAVWPVAQTTAAAVLAWVIAGALLAEPRPAFAPLGAIIALGVTVGQRGIRAVQVTVGVAVGLGTASLAVEAFGVGVWQLALVTSLALLAAVLLSSDPTLVVQAGVSGALVVAVGETEAIVPYRFLEALVGGAVALLFSQVLFPFDAVAEVRASARAVLDLVSDGLCRGARAFCDHDRDLMADAHRRLRDAAAGVAGVDEALDSARRTSRVTRRSLHNSPNRGRKLERYTEFSADLESIVSDSSALLRAGWRECTAGGAPENVASHVSRLGHMAEQLSAMLDGSETAAPVEYPVSHPDTIATDPVDGHAPPSLQAVGDLIASTADRLRRMSEAAAAERHRS